MAWEGCNSFLIHLCALWLPFDTLPHFPQLACCFSSAYLICWMSFVNSCLVLYLLKEVRTSIFYSILEENQGSYSRHMERFIHRDADLSSFFSIFFWLFSAIHFWAQYHYQYLNLISNDISSIWFNVEERRRLPLFYSRTFGVVKTQQCFLGRTQPLRCLLESFVLWRAFPWVAKT